MDLASFPMRCLAAFEAAGHAAKRHRLLLTLAASALFAAGAWYSVRSLELSLTSLELRPLLALVLLAPFSFAYMALGLQLMAQSTGTSIALGRATTISAFAHLAELLPIPGGAMVKAGALVAAGARLGQSSLQVVLTAVLWIALAALAGGAVLAAKGLEAAWFAMAGGSIGAITAFGWLVRSTGWRIANLTLTHRLFGIGLMMLRLFLSFHVLGIALAFADTPPFALAGIAGSAASIVPAGLGIAEVLAALMASPVAVPAGAAFLAVGIDRLVGLTASAAIALTSLLGRSAAEPAR